MRKHELQFDEESDKQITLRLTHDGSEISIYSSVPDAKQTRARRDLVAEGQTDLRSGERHAVVVGLQQAAEVSENALRGLWAQEADRKNESRKKSNSSSMRRKLLMTEQENEAYPGSLPVGPMLVANIRLYGNGSHSALPVSGLTSLKRANASFISAAL